MLLNRYSYRVCTLIYQFILDISQGFLCVAGPHLVAPKSPPVVCWPAIGLSPQNAGHNFFSEPLGAGCLDMGTS